jgi:hypothetical protein
MFGRRVARHRRRGTEWQLDLRPVLPSDSAADHRVNAMPASPEPTTDAVVAALEQIRVAVSALQTSVDQLSARLEVIDGRLESPSPRPEEPVRTRATRQARDASLVRDSASVPLVGRARRSRPVAPPPVTGDDAAQR